MTQSAGSRPAGTPVAAAASRLPRRVPWWVLPAGIFFGSRLIDTGLLLHAVSMQYTHLPAALTNLPPGNPPFAIEPPTFEHLLANWDGQWYRTIVQHGYPSSLPRIDGVVQQNAWAFYPLFPALVWCLMALGIPFGFAGATVSMVCAGFACCVLFSMLHRRTTSFTASATVTALCFSPTAVVFQLAYTEGLALLLVLLALDSLDRRRYRAFTVVVLVLGFTRPIVLPLAAVAALHGVLRWRARDVDPFEPRERRRVITATIAAALAFLIWPAVTGLVTGEFDAYFTTQRAWLVGEAGEAGGWSTWVAQMVTMSPVSSAVIAAILIAFTLRLSLRHESELWGFELRAWVVLYPLFILASTRPSTSFFRYLTLSGVLWWPFPEISEGMESPWARRTLLLALAVVGTLSQYFWVRAFWVVGPDSLGFP